MPTTPTTFPWSVLINPDWYDDPTDAGYLWTGDAASCEDAVNKALAECWSDNDRDDAPPTYDPGAATQDGFTVFSADIDFRELAAAYIRARRDANDSAQEHSHVGVFVRLRIMREAADRLDAAFKASGRDA